MLSWQCPGCGGDLVARTRAELRCRRCDGRYDRRGGVWRFAEGFRPAGFPPHRHPPLQAIEERHFWFAARDRLVIEWLERRLPAAPGLRVLDLGCGTGRGVGLLEAKGFEVVGVDGCPEPLAVAGRRATRATLVHGDICRLPFAAGQFDAVVALDVLEHVEPEPVLRQVARVLRPDAGLLLTVPALPFLWSRMDELAGHRCRYTVARLRRELAAAGFSLGGFTHYQFLLFPLVAASRLLARRAEQPLERRPPALVNRLLAAVNQAEVTLLSRWRLPWGSSLVAWGGRV